MKRRSFIKHAAHSLAIPGFLGSLGAWSTKGFAGTLDHFLRLANETDRVLVLIYLDGGNDGLNTVIPLANYSGLHQVRPHVIMPENSLLTFPGEDFAFHPSMTGLRSLYDEGRLQVIHSVGYPRQNFSHFRSKDIWMSGSSSSEIINSGWTGRYLEANHPEFPDGYPNASNPDPLAIEIGTGSSMLFQGEKLGFSMVINNPSSFYQLLDNTIEEGDAPEGPVGDKIRYIRLMAQQSQKYGAVIKEAAQKVNQQRPFPQNRLANQLRIVSRLIAGGLKTPLYMVRIGGFDTHDNQVESDDRTVGRHANLLRNLSDSILAFMQDCEFQGTADRVMGMTFSEFGRKIVSNDSGGTDHGAAAPMFIFGNMSEGGSLGDPPTITGEEVYRTNIPMQHDFRQVYSSLIDQWFNADNSAKMSVTLGENYDEVPVVKNGVITSIDQPEPSTFKFYPNPVRDFATVSFDASGRVKLDLIDSSGREVGTLYEGNAQGSPFTVNVDLSRYRSGRYILRLQNGVIRQTKHLIKL